MADVVKYGIQIPNRVFVGGVAFDTKEEELKEFFSKYGKIKECKIIKDNQNISRGFAFVTFEYKNDAIQTQQLGTVFFNQKKLNLGPAIRQKGVVFNGTKEAENEPVVSTGVYIHPSGYSYTVAPNGVWYFHSPDGTPPTNTPGSPPLAYTSDIVQKTQLHARRSSTGSSTCGSVTPPGNLDSSSMSLPVFHTPSPCDMGSAQTSQVIQTNTPYQTGAYIHHVPHVAFQNMSLSSHMPSNNCVSPMNTHIHVAPNVVPPSNQHVTPINSVNPAGSGLPVHYTRMTEMYVPYYTNQGEVAQQNCINASDTHMIQAHVDKQYDHCHYSISKPECQNIIPAYGKDAYGYPYCNDHTRPTTYIFPQHHQPAHMLVNEVAPGFYKKIVTKSPMSVHNTHPQVRHTEAQRCGS